jgi:hypothetical protein
VKLRFTVATIALTAASAFGQAHAEPITFNGRALAPEQFGIVMRLEQAFGVRLPNGAYWYDNRSGAMGVWNGPALAILPAGLALGGQMPADCSGGLTPVFVNGRSLHHVDVAALSRIVTVVPGRFWLDAQGNFGYEGGPALGNLIVLANQGSQGPHSTYSSSELGVIVNEAGACTSSGCFHK